MIFHKQLCITQLRDKNGEILMSVVPLTPAGPGVRGTPLLLSMSIRSVRFSISYNRPVSYKLSSLRYRISQELKIVTKFSYPMLFNCSIPEKLPCPTERSEKLLVIIKCFSTRISNPLIFLVVLACDSVDIKLNKSQNQFLQKRTFTTKHNGNALHRYLLSL